jgi:ketosteroid isomerase-like protein
MSELETVKSFYEALERGDVTAVVALLSDELTWTEAEGFPYYSGTWRTPQEVVEKLFVPLAHDWDGFSVRAESFVCESSAVVAFGAYGGINRATGRRLSAPFAHRWRVTDGQIVSFMQYTDTVVVQAAVRPI